MPSRKHERDHAATFFPDRKTGGLNDALRRPLDAMFGTPEEPTRLARFLGGVEEGAALSMMAYGGTASRLGYMRRFTQLSRRTGVRPSTLKKWTNIERGGYGLGVETKGDAYLRPATIYGGINSGPLSHVAWVHPDVIKAYPKMSEVPVTVVPDTAWVDTVSRARQGMTSWSRDGSTADGFSLSGGRGIAIRGERPGEGLVAFNERADRTLVHEMQHVAQDFDGIRPARSHASYAEYRADGREVEARNTANRIHLTSQERIEMPRSMTQDVKADLVQLDDKGGDNFGTFRNFLATDEVPDSLFGYPIAHDENGYTEHDIQFFKENPKAAGFYDLGDEDMDEDVPQQAAKARGTPEDEAIIRMGGDDHGRVRVSNFDKAMDTLAKRVVAETVPGAALLPPVARQVQADRQARFGTWYRGLTEEKRAEVDAILNDPQLSESDRNTMLTFRAPGYPNPELEQMLQTSALPGLLSVRDGYMLPRVSKNMLRRYSDPESYAKSKLNFDLLTHKGSQFRSGDYVVAHSPGTIIQTLERIQDLSPDSLWKAGARYFSALRGPVAQEAWNAGFFPFATVYTPTARLSNHFNATSMIKGASFAPVQLEGVTGLGGPTSRHMSARLLADESNLRTVPLYFQRPSGELVLATRLAGGPMFSQVSAAQTKLFKDKATAAFRDARATVRASALPGIHEDVKGGKTRSAYPGSLNNPGNLEKRKDRRQGEIDSPHARWAKFATPQDGLREMADAIRQIATVKLAAKGQPFTLRNFAEVYAPRVNKEGKPENDTDKYIADISADSGFDPDVELHRFDEGDMAQFLRSVVKFESGAPHSAWFTDEEYAEAAEKLQEGAFD